MKFRAFIYDCQTEESSQLQSVFLRIRSNDNSKSSTQSKSITVAIEMALMTTWPRCRQLGFTLIYVSTAIFVAVRSL